MDDRSSIIAFLTREAEYLESLASISGLEYGDKQHAEIYRRIIDDISKKKDQA